LCGFQSEARVSALFALTVNTRSWFMLILGIETSGSGGSIAVAQDRICLAESSLSREGRRHARTLVAEVRSLLAHLAVAPQRLDAVAVSIGPGSFTGLRVGVVCAKTLAYAVPMPLVAVDTFLAIAAQSPEGISSVQIVGDGQRGDLYVGRYQQTSQGTWRRSGDIGIRSAEAWLESLGSQDAASGPGLSRHLDEVTRRCRVLPARCHHPRAATIALLGFEGAASHEFADVWTIEPFYLRRSGAEEKADARKTAP
jgi:tRNA threonylcarbamoyladenosine biosynthesis protein TsaB